MGSRSEKIHKGEFRILGKNQKPPVACLRKGGLSCKPVSWKHVGGPKWGLGGEGGVGRKSGKPPTSFSPSFSTQIGFSAGMCSSKGVQTLQ